MSETATPTPQIRGIDMPIDRCIQFCKQYRDTIYQINATGKRPEVAEHDIEFVELMGRYLSELSRAREALTLLAPDTRTEWQPIETVPRDGTRVLVCDGNGTGTGRLLDDGSWAVGGGCGYHPTHWMPLPAAPSGKVVPHV